MGGYLHTKFEVSLELWSAFGPKFSYKPVAYVF